jgi:hypothetical protein
MLKWLQLEQGEPFFRVWPSGKATVFGTVIPRFES